MKIFTSEEKTPAAQIRDLVAQATATGEYTVACVEGVDIGAWPHDDPVAVFEDYNNRAFSRST